MQDPKISKVSNHTYNKFLYSEDSVVVITGASSGIGKELTFRYAERGCKLVIGARNFDDL